jgi:hypothetical protein
MRSPSITPLDARMHHISGQVVPQPLLLPSMFRQDIIKNINSAHRDSASSSSSLHRRSSLFKRDSAVSLQHAGSRSDARRISMRRSFQSSEAAFVENDPADFDLAEFLAEQPAQIMGPVYRLVRLTAFPSSLPLSAPTAFLALKQHRRRRRRRRPGVDGPPVLWRENAVTHQRDRLNIEPMGESAMGDQILLISRDLRFRPNAA